MCRSRRELSNAYLLAKFRFDTAENEPAKNLQIIDPLIPKDMFRLVCLVKLVFFAREGVAF